MKLSTSSTNMIIFFIIIIYSTINLFSPISSQPVCRKTCGKLPTKYPFGTGVGCGDRRFQQYITCNNNDDQLLTLTTHTGRYTITDIDYTNQVLYISDPTMSTCGCTQPSKGFGLDTDAPFSFRDDMIFTLLDCSTTSSSPIFASNGTVAPLCDERGGAPICSFLYSCKSISSTMMKLPLSTCCVYTPVDLGPAYEMDLEKLGCSSYSGFYGLNGDKSNPEDWKYGIAVKYRFNVYDEYPSSCGDCERSNGVCGYGGNGDGDDSFVCNCPSGLNTTTNCFFMASFNHGLRSLPWPTSGTWLLCFSAWIVVLMLS